MNQSGGCHIYVNAYLKKLRQATASPPTCTPRAPPPHPILFCSRSVSVFCLFLRVSAQLAFLFWFEHTPLCLLAKRNNRFWKTSQHNHKKRQKKKKKKKASALVLVVPKKEQRKETKKEKRNAIRKKILKPLPPFHKPPSPSPLPPPFCPLLPSHHAERNRSRKALPPCTHTPFSGGSFASHNFQENCSQDGSGRVAV